MWEGLSMDTVAADGNFRIIPLKFQSRSQFLK